MNIILDRFPLNSYLEAKCALEKSGHAVSLGVLTCQSVIPENFHDDFFVDRDVARGIVTDGATWILDKHNLKKASHHEGLAINVFSRYDIGQKNFSAQEMSSHYYDLYNFWLFQIKLRKINFCLHHYMPHDPSSFILYLVAKDNKIPTVFIDVPHIFNQYRFLSCSFEYRDLLLLSPRENGVDHAFPFRSESEIFGTILQQGGEKSVPMSIRYRFKQNSLIERLLNNIQGPFNIKLKLKSFLHFFLTAHKSANTFFKVSRYSWSSKRSDFTNFSMFCLRIYHYIKLPLARTLYEIKCEPIPDGKFIYFPMPGQPEASTLPAAFEFRDIFLVLRMLRSVIPDEIPIVIKENPSCFNSRNIYLSGVSYRSRDFYTSLKKIKNVSFVSIHEDSHHLIKESVLVATISGTAAIESVYLGKPAVVFSSNWYNKINGIFKVKSPNDLEKIWKIITVKGYSVKPNKSNISLDNKMMIKFSQHTPYEFNPDSRRNMIISFIAAIEKFGYLEDRKWRI